jgi:hypothetical protein
MQVKQLHLTSTGLLPDEFSVLGEKPDLIMVFGAKEFFSDSALSKQLKTSFPESLIAGCSTAGEIAVDRVYDNSCILSAIHFDSTKVKAVTTQIQSMEDSQAAGERLGKLLDHKNLNSVFILGTGVAINGSALVAGLQNGLPPNVGISGGLAADGGAFSQTWTLGPEGASDKHLVLIGFYGDKVKLSYGTFAGWEPFGPARKVTRCEQNVLYELDGAPALDIYKRYLGDYAKDLPGSGLLFPFEMLDSEREKQGIFRTILAVNHDDNSLTLAGDILPNGYLRLMHASTEKLISGAENAAQLTKKNIGNEKGDSLAILVSCIGRKLVMGDRVDEEVEAVADTLGKNTRITGFYSNGEISDNNFHGECRLHNQTMTITWITESE